MKTIGLLFALIVLSTGICVAQPYREIGLRIDGKSKTAAKVTIAGVRIDTGYIYGRRDDLTQAVTMNLLAGDVCHLLPYDDSLRTSPAFVSLPEKHGWLMPDRIRIVMGNGKLFLRVFEKLRKLQKKSESKIAKVDAYEVDRNRLIRVTYADGFEVQLYTTANVNLSYREGDVIHMPGRVKTKNRP